MVVSQIPATSGVAAPPLSASMPRALSAESALQFRELMNAPSCGAPEASCQAQAVAKGGLNEALDFSIEKILMANMPAANASAAEFAVGLLRAQVKVSQAAIAIETVSKTTQSLSQGVQSLTSRG